MHWVTLEQPDVKDALASLELDPIVRALLLQGGLEDAVQAEQFINPRLAHLDDPMRMTHVPEATERLKKAIDAKESVVVLGDYDVDGVTSTVLLIEILQYFGLEVSYIIPRRKEEGYGMSAAAVERLLSEHNPDLLVVLDCGTNSKDETAELRRNGVDVIIVDHHQCKEDVPEDCILINPHVYDREEDEWLNCCTVGLVFKLVHGLLKLLRSEGREEAERFVLKDMLDLVALGTVADLVPLRGENRIFVRHGLKRMRSTENTGLRALCDVSGMDIDNPVQPTDISFRLGPRINASGRLADASLPIQMLLGKDAGACKEAALKLDQLNGERQGIERKMIEEAEEMALSMSDDASAYVLFNKEWHSGVVGIVAGKMMRARFRPCIVLGTEGGNAKGSARSIPGINLVEALGECTDMLCGWGGHPMAAGVELQSENVDAFREAFVSAVARQLAGREPEEELSINMWLSTGEIGYGFFEALECLRPFGQQNPEPIFGLKDVILESKPKPFGQGHLRFELRIADGSRLSVVAWRQAENPPPVRRPIDMAVRFGWNCWNGRRIPQAEMLAWRE